VLCDNPVETLTQPANTSCQSLRSSTALGAVALALALLLDEALIDELVGVVVVVVGEHRIVAVARRRKCMVVACNGRIIDVDAIRSVNVVRVGRSEKPCADRIDLISTCAVFGNHFCELALLPRFTMSCAHRCVAPLSRHD
jgi:hypothetical protein